MVQQTFYSRQRTGYHICAHFRTLHNMLGIANRCCQHLRFIAIQTIHIYDLSNKSDAITANIIQTTDKRRYISSTYLSCQQCLSCRKNKRTIRTDTFLCEIFNSFYPIRNTRYFYHNMIIQCSKFFALTNHAFIIRGNYFGADITMHNITNINIMFPLVFNSLNPFFSHQGRICRYTVKNTKTIRFLDLSQIGCVDKEFHNIFF